MDHRRQNEVRCPLEPRHLLRLTACFMHRAGLPLIASTNALLREFDDQTAALRTILARREGLNVTKASKDTTVISETAIGLGGAPSTHISTQTLHGASPPPLSPSQLTEARSGSKRGGLTIQTQDKKPSFQVSTNTIKTGAMSEKPMTIKEYVPPGKKRTSKRRREQKRRQKERMKQEKRMQRLNTNGGSSSSFGTRRRSKTPDSQAANVFSLTSVRARGR